MLAGFLTSAVWALYFKEFTYNLYEAVPGFAAGLLGTWLVSKMTYREPDSAPM